MLAGDTTAIDSKQHITNSNLTVTCRTAGIISSTSQASHFVQRRDPHQPLRVLDICAKPPAPFCRQSCRSCRGPAPLQVEPCSCCVLGEEACVAVEDTSLLPLKIPRLLCTRSSGSGGSWWRDSSLWPRWNACRRCKLPCASSRLSTPERCAAAISAETFMGRQCGVWER